MFRSALIAAASIVSCTAFAQDAVQTDGDKYRVMLENDCVRVLDYHDLPGEQTHQHTHPAFVLYTLTAFKRQITLPNGKVLQREFKEGDVMWSDQQTHIGTNVGETPTHVVIVELKSTTGPCTRK